MSSSSKYPFLVVGLGNPGPEYAHTRHNIGFEVVDLLAQRLKNDRFTTNKSFNALMGEVNLEAGKVVLMKPQTFMNLSGVAVQKVAAFYKIDPSQQLLVVTDDLDLPTGQLRLRMHGGSGGHNGLRSIIEMLGNNENFARLRIGIGRPPENEMAKPHVLKKAKGGEREILEKAIGLGAEAVETCIQHGLAKAMNVYNKKGTADES